MRYTPIAGAFLICFVCLLTLTGQMASAQTTQPPVVISQIYGGGGNSGALYTHDFVELFNRGEVPVSLAGWSVQYASATGTNWQKTELTGTIQPGGYYLIQQAQGRRGTRPLPTPDVIGAIPMSVNRGKVALLNTAELLPRGTACPDSPSLVDLMGFGDTDCFDGLSPAQALDSKTASVRADGGCTHTGNNGNDFSPAPSTPRNSTFSPNRCHQPPPPRLSSSGAQNWGTPTPTVPLVLPSTTSTAFNTIQTVAAPISATVQTPLTSTTAARLTGSTDISSTKGLVISQLYGGGGNADAAYTHDFVELVNASALTVELAGWSLQYASATGKTWLVTVLSGTIAPGQNYLIQQAEGRGGHLSLPRPDATGETAMSASSGKVALVSSVEPLAGICPAGELIVDFVGYGNANCFEGEGPTARPSNTRAIRRNGDGRQETDDNRADFITAPPEPRQ